MMLRTTLIVGLALWSGCLIAADARPNVIVIISDDQGWRDMGYNGSEILTPNLDRLAKTGVRLDSNYVCPTCSPTRIALLAGRNPSRYGVLGPIGGRSKQSLPLGTPTIASVLKKAGYYTAISGKWHLGLRPEVGPRQYGFDSTYGYLHGQVDPYTHIYKNGDATWHRQDKLITEKGHATDLLTAEAIRVIERKSDQPFFLYVAYSVPHYPLQEPAKWTSLYDGKIDDPDRKLFAASLTHMDDGIGKIVAALDRTGKRKNTLFIYTSDNGGQKSWSAPKTEYSGRFRPNKTLGDNRPLRGWKGDLHEGGIRVPAFVNWPGTLKSTVIPETVSALDWFPTIAKFCDVRVDANWKLEGIDIGPTLREEPRKRTAQRILYWKTGRQWAVRVGGFKLIATKAGKAINLQLFDVKSDPNEKNDLAGKQPDRVKSLQAELRRQQSLDR